MKCECMNYAASGNGNAERTRRRQTVSRCVACASAIAKYITQSIIIVSFVKGA